MFNRQTLFVLGAGASKEVGLPDGKDLAAKIKTKMDVRFENGYAPIGTGDIDLFQRLTLRMQKEVREYQDAAWLIRDGIRLAQSIDDFLDVHRTNRYVNLYGKSAIVKSVLEAERDSDLYFNSRDPTTQTIDTDKIADTWFVKFMHALGRRISKENVREIFDRISFIVFNYDRCVEFFLLHALRSLYHIEEREAKSIVDDLNIIHPYGAVGNVDFGNTNADHVALANGIKTYTEQVANAEIISRLGAEVTRADVIVFLGFGYHSQNMDILKPREPMRLKNIYGTAYNMSDADVDVVSRQIASFMEGHLTASQRPKLIKLENKLKSAGLFDHYSKSLTGGD